MHIEKIELNHIAIALAEPYKLSKRYGTITHAHAVVIRMTTDDGLVGLGEADPLPPFTAETPATVLAVIRDQLADCLLGEDPRQLVRLNREVERRVTGNPMARGALDMALMDLAGKAYQIPAHIMLGGRLNDRLPLLLAAIGGASPEADARSIKQWLDRGISHIMIKMGAASVKEDIKRMRLVQTEFAGRARFIVDANQGWAPAEALEFVNGTADYAPDLIEQPVDAKSIDDLSRIRRHSMKPVSADESLVELNDARRLIRDRAVDVFSLKASKNGGMNQTRQIALVAGAFGVDCLMNSMLEFGITQAALLQVGCTLPNLFEFGHAYGSVLRMSDDITDFGKNIDQGHVNLPTGNGLGVGLDVEKLNHYTLEQEQMTL
ncbi:MAG: enolase C-terminal domain-like protein [Desulfobacteraceae bacterium]|jgi:muconate cycloisomerase